MTSRRTTRTRLQLDGENIDGDRKWKEKISIILNQTIPPNHPLYGTVGQIGVKNNLEFTEDEIDQLNIYITKYYKKICTGSKDKRKNIETERLNLLWKFYEILSRPGTIITNEENIKITNKEYYTNKKDSYESRKKNQEDEKYAVQCGEIICTICKKATYTEDNNIVLCDCCDLGYHQKCLKPTLVDIPKDEWFCPTCMDNKCKNCIGKKRSECIKKLPLSTEQLKDLSGKDYFSEDERLLKLVAISDSIHDFGKGVYYNGLILSNLFKKEIDSLGEYKSIIDELLDKIDRDRLCTIKKTEPCFEKSIINKVLFKNIENINKIDTFEDENISQKFDFLMPDNYSKFEKEISFQPFINVTIGKKDRNNPIKNTGLFKDQNKIKEIFTKYYDVASNNLQLEINSSFKINYANNRDPLYELWHPSTGRIFDNSTPSKPIVDNINEASLDKNKELFQINKIMAVSSDIYNNNDNKVFVKIVDHKGTNYDINNLNCSITNLNPVGLLLGITPKNISFISPQELQESIICETMKNILSSINDSNERARIIMDWKRGGDILQAKIAKANNRIFVTGDRIAWMYAVLSGCPAVYGYIANFNTKLTMYNPQIKIDEKQIKVENRNPFYIEDEYLYFDFNNNTCSNVRIKPSQIIEGYKKILYDILMKLSEYRELNKSFLDFKNVLIISNIIHGFTLLLSQFNNLEGYGLIKDEFKTLLGNSLCQLISILSPLSKSENDLSDQDFNKLVDDLNSTDIINVIDINFNELLNNTFIVIELPPSIITGGTSSSATRKSVSIKSSFNNGSYMDTNSVSTPSPSRVSIKATSNQPSIMLTPKVRAYYMKKDIIIPFHPLVPSASAMLRTIDSSNNVRNRFIDFVKGEHFDIMGANHMYYDGDDLSIGAIAEFLIEASTDLARPLFYEFIMYMNSKRGGGTKRKNSRSSVSLETPQKSHEKKKVRISSLKHIIDKYLEEVRKVRYDVYNNYDLIARMYQYSIYDDIEDYTESSTDSMVGGKKTRKNTKEKIAKLDKELASLYEYYNNLKNSSMNEAQLQKGFERLEGRISHLASKIKKHYTRDLKK